MIQFLDTSVSIPSLIWMFLVAFMLHDFEEIIRIEPWFRKNSNQIYNKIPKRFHKNFYTFSSMTSSRFSIAVCTEFIVFIPVTFWAVEKGSYLLFLGFNVILLLHVFMHVGQALFLRMLVPGVVTAVVITLPYSIYLFYRLLDEDLIEMADILLSAPFGLLLIPILWIGHKLGDKLVP
ncbi:HXXEE domain-containing protein [Bacillus sp. CGMCC 1.16607]|uniref:HXXEE domain-containing protein n=1 Tax=Bacillus sp. CGMCC 1.16607 TaxID=3351842 RepID=UPI00363040C6